MPVRIQRKRVKGWRMPEKTVCVTRWGKFSNPYIPGKNCETREEAVELFERDLLSGALRTGKKRQFKVTVQDVRRELRGKNLACFCKEGDLCHGDILLSVANAEEA